MVERLGQLAAAIAIVALFGVLLAESAPPTAPRSAAHTVAAAASSNERFLAALRAQRDRLLKFRHDVRKQTMYRPAHFPDFAERWRALGAVPERREAAEEAAGLVIEILEFQRDTAPRLAAMLREYEAWLREKGR